MKGKNKHGQEEMVGFGLILILVAVVFIVFISVYIRKPSPNVTDFQANSFVQSVLQYTTTCQEDNLYNLTIQELIRKCKDDTSLCYSPRNINIKPCTILVNTIKGITQESWDVGPKKPIKGYSYIINISYQANVPQRKILDLSEGVVTNLNCRAGEQDFGDPDGEGKVLILFNVCG